MARLTSRQHALKVTGDPVVLDAGRDLVGGPAHLAASGVRTLYIEPGAPWENAYSETFVSRLRDELLDRELFATLKEAKVLAEDYRKHYNHHRPHGALGYLTPAEFADLHQLPLQQDPPGAGEETEKLQCVPGLPSCWYREWGPVTSSSRPKGTNVPSSRRRPTAAFSMVSESL